MFLEIFSKILKNKIQIQIQFSTFFAIGGGGRPGVENSTLFFLKGSLTRSTT